MPVLSDRLLCRTVLPLCAAVLLALADAAIARQATPPPTPQIEDLGNELYRIGNIFIDKAKGEFSVRGTVIRHEPPIEFIVTIKDGMKSYESVIEIDADAYQFNLACILIGLDSARATPFEKRTEPSPLEGDRVDVRFSWNRDGEVITAPAAELLTTGEPPVPVKDDEWIYTGSAMVYGNDYLAQVTGAVLGFVRRAESIIEHRTGIGVGDYGSVSVNTGLLPEVGAPISMTVRRSSKPFTTD